MGTVRQLLYRYMRKSKVIRPLVPALKKCPQKRGVVQKVFIQTPKKPNSAKRKVAKVKLSTGRIISCYIPGMGHKLTKHSVVLVRGGRAQDLIGVRYKPIFGKFDFSAPTNRISRRSKYGLSNKYFQKNLDKAAVKAAAKAAADAAAKAAVLRNKRFRPMRRRNPIPIRRRFVQLKPISKTVIIPILTDLQYDISKYLHGRK
jgi:small subunit ribosomal protein S12